MLYAAPRWPLSLHLYEAPRGPLIYTFYEAEGVVITENEHGCESLSGFEAMPSTRAFWLYDLAPGKWMELACGGVPMWGGRVEDRKVQGGGFGWTAFGGQRAMSDAPNTHFFSKKSYSGWQAGGGEIASQWHPERFDIDNNNRLWIGLLNGKFYDFSNYGVIYFKLPHRSTPLLKEIEFDYDIYLDTNWIARFVSWDEGFTSGSTIWTLNGTGTQQTATGQTVTLSTARPILGFQVLRNVGSETFAGNDVARYGKITNLRLKGSDSANVYADEVISYLLSGLASYNPTQVSASIGGIQSPGLDLDEAIWQDMYFGEILNDLVARGDNQTPPRVWEWQVWEDQVLRFQPQGDGAPTWYVDVDEEFVLDSTLNTLFNQAYALYQDPTGRTLRTAVATDAESYSQHGIYRRAAVQAGNTTSQTTAEAARDAFLNDNALIKPRAQIVVLRGPYTGTGVEVPRWMPRAGDTFAIRNLPPNLSAEIDRIRRFRMSRKEYRVEEDVLIPTPEFPLPGIEYQIVGVG